MFMTLAPGTTLQEAASGVFQQYKLQALESKEVSVNGLKALAVVGTQQQQQGQQQQQAAIRTLSYFIQYDNNIYHTIGVSSATDFNAYAPLFTNTMQSFKVLTDASKLNKKPDRVRIKTINQNTTLEQALRQHGVQTNKLEEHAILNGLKLGDRIVQGTLIKVIAP